MGLVVKITLDDDLATGAKQEAEKRHIPVATLIRMAIVEYLGRHSSKGKGA